MLMDEETANEVEIEELMKIHAKKLPAHRKQSDTKSSGRGYASERSMTGM